MQHQTVLTQEGDRPRLSKVLFVVGQLTVGGVETYILRVTRALRAAGIGVEVWVVKHKVDSELFAELQAMAKVRLLTPKWFAYPIFLGSPGVPDDVDMVFTTGRTALFCAAQACASAGRPVRLIAGVYSQWEYVPDHRYAKSRLASALLDQLGPGNMVFCTEGCRADHVPSLGSPYRHSPVSPLLVDLPSPAARVRRSPGDTLEIVTVSRLVDFKTSNIQMPQIVAELNARGIPVRWTLYGDGPERENIETLVKEAGVGAFVSLRGSIQYSDLARVIGEADLYIGAGTTLIEASALGVPALVAPDSNPAPTSPGLFCDRPGTFTSDASDGDILVPILDHIAAIARLDPRSALELSERSRRRAAQYGTSRAPAEYENIFRHAKPVKVALSFQFRLAYFMATCIELARVLLGLEAQPARYGQPRTSGGPSDGVP